MDIWDRATAKEEQDREDAIARARARAPRGVSRERCANAVCGQEIPEERRRAIPGVRFCVECQQLNEKKER